MKKVVILALLGFITLKSTAQSTLPTRSFSYSNTTSVYTPMGNAVAAKKLTNSDWTSSEKSQIASYLASHYNNVTVIADATGKYNCHSYAWNIREGGPVCWINNTSSFQQYMTDGSYVETTAPYAEKIYYSIGDHSAVKSSVSGMYESKWGAYAVVRHALTVSPYNASNLRYFARPPQFSGDLMIGGTEQKTYTINCIPVGQNLSLTCTSSLLNIVSQTSNSITVRPASSSLIGDAEITARFTNSSGQLVKQIKYYVGIKGPHWQNVSLRVVRSDDGSEVYPNGGGLEPNTYYYAYLSSNSGTLYDVNWGANSTLNIGYATNSELYFSTGEEGWGTLNISAKISPYNVTKSILGVTLYGSY